MKKVSKYILLIIVFLPFSVLNQNLKRMKRFLLPAGIVALLCALPAKGQQPSEQDSVRMYSFIRAARPERAIPLYELFKKELASLLEGRVESGEFGADMHVSLINDGPVTIFMDSRKRE